MNANKLIATFFLVLIIVSILPVSAQWCGVQVLYFQNAPSSDIPGYEQLINYPSGAAQTDEAVTVRNTLGPVLIDTYISPAGLPDVQMIERGLRRYRTFSYVSGTAGVTTINFTPFVRTAQGTERNLYTVFTDDINDLVPNEQLTPYVSAVNLTMNKTDRLGIRVTGQTSHSSDIVLHWVYEGSYNYSTVESGNFVCEPTLNAYGSGYTGVDAPVTTLIPIVGFAVALCVFAQYRKR